MQINSVEAACWKLQAGYTMALHCSLSIAFEGPFVASPAFGIWHLEFGIWYLVSKAFEDPFVASPAFDIWYLAFGIKSTFYPFLFLPNNFYGSKEKVEILSTNSF